MSVVLRCKSKIVYYNFLRKIFPSSAFQNLCDKKIDKYKRRLKIFVGEYNLLTNDSKCLQSNLSKYNSVCLELSKTNKKRIFIVGSLDNNTEEALFSNVILKNIEYDNSIVHFYNRDTHSLIEYNNEAYLQNKSYRNNLYYLDIENIDASYYDIGIVLSDFSAELLLPYKMPKIAYLYNYAFNINKQTRTSVLMESVNRNFDAVFVPNIDQKTKLANICRPIIELPISLDMAYYSNIKSNTTKNIICFADVKRAYQLLMKLKPINRFLQEKGITIIILYKLGDINLNIKKYKKQKDFIGKMKKQAKSNIICKKADTLQYFCEIKKYAKMADAFIYTEQSEAFTNNPRLLLAAGKVVFVPESYNIEDISGVYKYNKNFLNVIKKYILEKEQVDKDYPVRKEYADKYSKDKLKIYYKALTDDKLVKTSEKTELKDDYFNISDKNLFIKYQKYFGHKEFIAPDNLTVVPVNDAGFFSVYNKQVSLMVYAADNEVLIPDWRMSRFKQNIYKYWGSTTPGSFCYGKYSDGNIFLKLFESPYDETVIAPELYESDIIYDYANKVVDLPEYNFDKEPNLTYIYSYELPKDPEYFSEFRHKYNHVVKTYMKPKQYIQKIIDDFYTKNLEGHFCISIHVRCSAHASELLEDTQFKKYNDNILNILEKNGIDKNDKNWRLFIATDNEVALNYFNELYPDNIVYQKDVERLTCAQEEEYQKIKKSKKKDVGGYELQHRNASEESSRSVKLAVDILTDAYLLSKCEYFIYQNSNVTTAVSYLNPNLKMIYCK